MKTKRINKTNQGSYIPRQGELFGYDTTVSDNCVYMCVNSNLDNFGSFSAVRISSPKNDYPIGLICACNPKDRTMRPLEQVGELVVKEV
jgi:hypothetical protein